MDRIHLCSNLKEIRKMKSIVRASLLLVLLAALSWAADDMVSAVHGTVTKVDSTTKTVVVKTKDGTEHTIKFVDKTTVHGVKAAGHDTAMGAKDSFHGIKEGSEVVAHYTAKGAEKTAVEVDDVGKDGIKSVGGTVTHIDRAGKTIAVKTADGTEETFKLSGHAADDAGKDIGKGTEKTAHVTVYYTEDAGKKTAHFFEKL
jgi:arginine repressor